MVEIVNQHFIKLKTLFDDILQAKNNNDPNINSKRTNAALLFVALKHSHRNIKYKIKEGREALHAEKSKADICRLQLQNLLYEVNHLKREIVRCHQFRSRDCNIELLSQEEYMNVSQLRIKAPTIYTDHSMHLVLLEYELNLRKELSQSCKILQKSKQDLIKEIENKTERYTSFGPALRTLRESTRPLHDALQMSLEAEWKLGSLVQLLPKPLYILFMNLKSLQNLNFDLVVDIIGSESKVFDRDSLIEENKLQIRKNLLSDITSTLQQPHPLSIQLKMKKKNQNVWFALNVWYFDGMDFATANCEIISDEGKDDNPEVQSILKHLYTNDLGNDIPIIGINYKLKKLDMDVEKCIQYLDENNYGRPYRWIHKICSLTTFCSVNPQSAEICLERRTRNSVTKLLNRWLAWMKLMKDIKRLTLKEVDLCALGKDAYPFGLSCSLVQWTSIGAEEFENCKSDVLSVTSSIASVRYSCYRAVIVRGSAKMECLIRICPNYPFEAPLWIICIHWNGHHSSFNNSSVKMIEYWTNALNINELKNKSKLLYAQLFRTMFSFDVFLETEGSMQSNVEYTKEKPYINAFSKRIRLRPLKFIKRGTAFVFKQ